MNFTLDEFSSPLKTMIMAMRFQIDLASDTYNREKQNGLSDNDSKQIKICQKRRILIKLKDQFSKDAIKAAKTDTGAMNFSIKSATLTILSLQGLKNAMIKQYQHIPAKMHCIIHNKINYTESLLIQMLQRSYSNQTGKAYIKSLIENLNRFKKSLAYYKNKANYYEYPRRHLICLWVKSANLKRITSE